jgi:hypothetical protein
MIEDNSADVELMTFLLRTFADGPCSSYGATATYRRASA